MSKMIQICNVPEDLHRVHKARASLQGMSLSDYLLAEIRRATERPTLQELRDRLQRRESISPSVSPGETMRAEREGR